MSTTNEDLKVEREVKMTFETEEGNLFSVTLGDAKEDLDGEGVSVAMDNVLSKYVLMNSKGELAAYSRSADYITTTTQRMFDA